MAPCDSIGREAIVIQNALKPRDNNGKSTIPLEYSSRSSLHPLFYMYVYLSKNSITQIFSTFLVSMGV